MLGEIDQVMDMIDVALGSTTALRRVAAGLLERPRRPGRPHAHPRHDREPSCAPRSRSRRRTSTSRRGSRKPAARSRRLRETLECVRVEAITDPVTGIANRKHFQDMLHKSVEAANARQNAARARRHRHRPFQALQRPLRPPHRRPGPAPRQHDHARAGQEQGDARPLRRRGVRHHPAGDERLRTRGGRRGHPPERAEPGTREALHRRIARQDHGLGGRRELPSRRGRHCAARTRRPVHVCRQAHGP